MNLRRLRVLLWLTSLIAFMSSVSSHAVTITNADLVGGIPTTTLPSGYGSESGQALLLDGITANPGTGPYVASDEGGGPLSPSNYISIVATLIDPFVVNAVRIANDFGGVPNSEVTAMDVIFSSSDGPIASFSATGLDDDVIDDIDDVITGINVGPVKSIEFRITGGQMIGIDRIELREIIVEGQSIPEPSSFLLTGMAVAGIVVCRRRRSRKVRIARLEGLPSRALLLATLSVCLTLSPAVINAGTIESTFDSDLEGWTADVPFSYQPTGGNPGGYLRTGDIGGGATSNAIAPPQFLGDLTSFKGGTISVDLIGFSQSGVGGGEAIILEGPTDSAFIQYSLTPIPFVWTTFVVPMNAADWGKTEQEWDDLLSNVTTLKVGVDPTSSGADRMGLDNFRIERVPEPSTFVLSVMAVSAILLGGTRRSPRQMLPFPRSASKQWHH